MSPTARQGVLSRAAICLGLAVTVCAVLLGLLGPQLSTAHAAPAAAASSAVASAAAPTVQQMTQRVIDDTNAIRYQQGLPGLVRDSRLDQVAANWAHQQFVNGAMSHNPNYSTQIPAGWQRAGENVAKGYSYTTVVNAWKNSASHYANLVNDYTSVGVGYYEQDGVRYWSQVFAKYPGTVQPTAPAPAPAATTPSAPAPTAPPAPTTTPTPVPTTPSTPAPSPSTASPAAEPAAPAGTSVTLSSPSFESGLGTWTASTGKVDGPNSSARGGTKSLLVTGASGRLITQRVTTQVNAGSSHTLVVWVRADAAAKGTVTLRTVGGSNPEVATVSYSAASSGWLKVSVALTTKVAHSGFTIEIAATTSGRTYRIDSVSLTRTANGTAAGATPPVPAPTTTSTPTPAPSTTAPAASAPSAPAPAPSTPAPAPSTPAPAPTTPAPAPSTPAPAPSPRPTTLWGILFGG